MSNRDIRAIQNEYNELASELRTVCRSLDTAIKRVETDIAYLSRPDTFYSRDISGNVLALLGLIRTDLIAPNEINLDNLEQCLNSFISGIDHHDVQS